jgi:hypothetical protein
LTRGVLANSFAGHGGNATLCACTVHLLDSELQQILKLFSEIATQDHGVESHRCKSKKHHAVEQSNPAQKNTAWSELPNYPEILRTAMSYKTPAFCSYPTETQKQKRIERYWLLHLTSPVAQSLLRNVTCTQLWVTPRSFLVLF